jgi:hypothetical protein
LQDEQQQAFEQQISTSTTVDEIPNPSDLVLEKVNIQGLDNLTTNDVKTFIAENDTTDNFVRLEWINDTSANIVFQSAQSALQALNTFTNSGITEWSITTIPSSGVRTKPLSAHPDADLRVRLATVRDVKVKGSHERSRFYLLNPQYDPVERARIEGSRGGRGDRRNGRGDRGEFTRRPFDDRELRRRQDGDTFDANMYDDDAGLGSRNGSRRRDDGDRKRNGSRNMRRESWSSSRDMDTSGDDSGRKRVHFGPRRTDNFGRLRGRSASPGPDGDGRMGFEEGDDSVRRRIRQRSQTPPSYRREARNKNQSKELFSVEPPASALRSSSSNGNELFANRSSPSRKTANHRRNDAVDASAVENPVPEIFVKKPRSLSERITPRSLSDRITLPPGGDLASRITSKEESYGRLKGDNSAPSEGINIRGTAVQASGFSIRGAADNDGTELFKDRELFGQKIKGRGGPRRKAEDLFG